MKRTLLSIITLALVSSMYAQELVTMGAGYANQVFYSLENGIVSTSPSDNWDLAFETGGFGSVIRINGGWGAELSLYNGPMSDFENLDTAQISSWTKLRNIDTSWAKGAFNQFETSDYDLGWGMYNMTTHQVKGDSLYVFKTIDGDYKKLYVEKLLSGTYHLIHANLDNSNLDTTLISKADFNTKNFVYYSFKDKKVVDQEPNADLWDLTFTKYITEYSPGVPYGVTGVLQNNDVLVAEVSGDESEKLLASAGTFQREINTIGFDWKKLDYNTFQYAVEDSLAYFIKGQNASIYKVVFTAFGGSANGNFSFTKEIVLPTSVASKAELIHTYPNPAQDVIYSSVENGTVSLYDLNGQKVFSEDFYNGVIDISTLSQGFYSLQILSESILYHTTIIKK